MSEMAGCVPSVCGGMQCYSLANHAGEAAIPYVEYRAAWCMKAFSFSASLSSLQVTKFVRRRAHEIFSTSKKGREYRRREVGSNTVDYGAEQPLTLDERVIYNYRCALFHVACSVYA